MHAQTPHLTVVDPRGLAVRVLDYHRDTPGAQAQLRVRHARFDARGRQVELRDPRLWCVPQAPANLTNVHSLSGQVLASEGVDDGMGCSLSNEAGQVGRQWDGRGETAGPHAARWSLKPASTAHRAIAPGRLQ